MQEVERKTIYEDRTPEPPTFSSPQPTNMAKMFLTVQEAAQRLGVTEGWIYERTRRKLIPHRKLGKFVRFTEEDLQTISAAAATGSLR
jgi:excisionase family DNA binding protein